MITRFASSLSLALCATFSLLLLMQTLIATGIRPVETSVEIDPPRFNPRRPDTPVEADQDVEPPPPVQPPPETKRIVPTKSIKVAGGGLSIIPHSGIKIPLGIPGRPNGGVVPIAIMQPQYPNRARQRGLEGYVVVEFTVSEIGNVINAVIVDSSSSLFERSALNAVGRFKYKPQIVDGVAIETPGIRYLFSFTLEG
jgi:protein TonB